MQHFNFHTLQDPTANLLSIHVACDEDDKCDDAKHVQDDQLLDDEVEDVESCKTWII